MTTLVFQGVLTGAFLFDDVPLILENPAVRTPGHWKQIFFGSIWSSRGLTDSGHFYRPLEIMAYRMLYWLAGPNPALFHLVQLCIYACTVCLLFHVGRKLLQNSLASFVGALLWALHPLHVEPVAWISALGEAFSALLVMMGFALFLRAESSKIPTPARHALPAWLYFVALLFKELAFGFPLLVIAYWYFLGDEESWTLRAKRWFPYALATAAYCVLRVSALGRHSSAAQPFRITLRVVAAALGLMGQHAKLFAWPVRLSTAREFVLADSLHSPWPWMALTALLAAFAAGRRQLRMGFLIAWWGITLSPCLDIRQLVGSPVGDRFSYLPSVGLCLALAYGTLLLLPGCVVDLRIYPAVLAALPVVAALWTAQDLRNIPHWRSEDALWSHAASAAPDSAFSHRFRGMSLEYEKGDLEAAAREYQTAIRLNQAGFRPLTGMLYECDLGLGRIALRKGQREEAVSYFQAAVNAIPTLSPAYEALGAYRFAQRDYKSAAQCFNRAVHADPHDVGARFYLGTCWKMLGQPAQAAEQFHAAREVDPTYSQAYLAEAAALDAEGDPAGAAKVRALVGSK